MSAPVRSGGREIRTRRFCNMCSPNCDWHLEKCLRNLPVELAETGKMPPPCECNGELDRQPPGR